MMWLAMQTIQPGWISALFAGFSLVGAAVTLVSNRTANRNSFRLQWTRDVVAWSSRVVDTLASAQGLCEAAGPEDVAAFPYRHIIAANLSALIDEGRFFFENKPLEGYGLEKPPAFRGVRPRMLSVLVQAHDYLKSAVIPNPAGRAVHCERLWHIRQLFVSDIQQIIEPRWLSKLASYEKSEGPNA
jgi:hypothetical protein